jgi:hypothetical protein
MRRNKGNKGSWGSWGNWGHKGKHIGPSMLLDNPTPQDKNGDNIADADQMDSDGDNNVTFGEFHVYGEDGRAAFNTLFPFYI